MCCSTAPVVAFFKAQLVGVPVIWDAGGLGGGDSFCNMNKLQGYRGITWKGDQVNCERCQIMILLL